MRVDEVSVTCGVRHGAPPCYRLHAERRAASDDVDSVDLRRVVGVAALAHHGGTRLENRATPAATVAAPRGRIHRGPDHHHRSNRRQQRAINMYDCPVIHPEEPTVSTPPETPSAPRQGRIRTPRTSSPAPRRRIRRGRAPPLGFARAAAGVRDEERVVARAGKTRREFLRRRAPWRRSWQPSERDPWPGSTTGRRVERTWGRLGGASRRSSVRRRGERERRRR